MVDLMHFLTNLLFPGIPLLYYYANFNLSIICYLSSGDTYLNSFIRCFATSVLQTRTYVLGTNLNSSIISCLSSGDMYLSLGQLFLHLLLLFHYLVILQQVFLKYLLFYQQFYYQSNHQLFRLFVQLLFSMLFLLHPLQIFWHYQLFIT